MSILQNFIKKQREKIRALKTETTVSYLFNNDFLGKKLGDSNVTRVLTGLAQT